MSDSSKPIPQRHLDRIGQIMGSYTVIDVVRAYKKSGKFGAYNLLCKCQCGVIQTTRTTLGKGALSCIKCRHLFRKKPAIRHSHAKLSHRTSGSTPEYRIWNKLKQICNKSNHSSYYLYGKRGIKVCEEWSGARGFINFIKDMGNKPLPKHHYTIARYDENSDFSPSNCCWVITKHPYKATHEPKHSKICTVCAAQYLTCGKTISKYCSEKCKRAKRNIKKSLQKKQSTFDREMQDPQFKESFEKGYKEQCF